MPETTTWITVVDTAVKVCLGALIGGGISIVATYLSQRRESAKQYNDKKREQLLEAALQFHKFHATVGVYWANVRNAAYKKENKDKLPPRERLSKKERAVLAKNERDVFDSFPILGECNTRLLLMGDKESSKRLLKYGEITKTFFAESHIDNKKTTQKNLDAHKTKLEAEKVSFMNSLHERYRSNK